MKITKLVLLTLLLSSCSLTNKNSSSEKVSSTFESTLSTTTYFTTSLSTTESSLSSTTHDTSSYSTISESSILDSSSTTTTSSSTLSVDPYYDIPLVINFIDFKSDGDCTLIQYGDIDILIDAGGTGGKASVEYITSFLSENIKDNVIEYLIVSHNDQDHIAALSGYVSNSSGSNTIEKYTKGVLGLYQVENFIDNGVERTTQVYNRYVDWRNYQVENYGANYYAAKEFFYEGNSNIIEFSPYFKMEVLNTKYYEKPVTNDNNNSVGIRFHFDDKNYLFLGDAEYDGEDEFIKKNDIYPATLYKASHHGSNTANNDILLSKITPTNIIIPCGPNSKYGFPQQDCLNRLYTYSDNIYATSICSTIKVTTKVGEDLIIEGKDNTTPLKDSDWFKENRTYIHDTNA